MTIVWCTPKRGGRQSANIDYAIRLTTQSKGKSAALGRALAIYIAADLAGDMRWIKGDKIKVGFDLDSKLIVLERDKEVGYTLTRDKTRNNKSPFYIRVSRLPDGINHNDLVTEDQRFITTDEVVVDKFKVAFSFARA